MNLYFARAYYIRGNVTNEMAFSGWGLDYGTAFSIPPNKFRIWGLRLNSTKTQINFFDTDGVNDFTTTLNTSASGLKTPMPGYYVGSGGVTAGNYQFQGDIAEIIYYQGTLTDPDRNAVENYLRGKYFGNPTGGTLVYQWQRNGMDITGATNASLVLTNAQPAQSGNYTVVISNQVGSVTSDIALVRVRYLLPVGNGQRLTNDQYSFVTSANISFQKYFTNGTIFYTLDGSTPSFASRPYSAPFTLNRSATLRAIVYSPDFSQWGESDPVNITIMPTYTLTGVTAGGGTVAIGGTGPFLSNTVVNVTANPSNGWTFLQWLGDATGTNPATAVAMTRNKSARAVFGTTLSTTVAGNGAVFLNPNVGRYPFGSVVRLMAVPDSGSFFGIWGNAASGNTNPLDFVVINPNPTVSSLFSTLSAGQFALTLSANGFGRVVVSPRANSYASGQNVTLTATADSEQTFLGWTGDASGTNNPLIVNMSQSRNVTANFSKNARLTLTFAPSTVELEGFQLTLNGAFGESYSLQKSSNLVDWTTFVTVTNSFGTTQLSDLPSTNSSAQFYRTIQP